MNNAKILLMVALWCILTLVAVDTHYEKIFKDEYLSGRYAAERSGLERGIKEGIAQGKPHYVYVIDVNQPRVWGDGVHDDGAALNKILSRAISFGEDGRPLLVWFPETKTYLAKTTINIPRHPGPLTLQGGNFTTGGDHPVITVEGNHDR